MDNLEGYRLRSYAELVTLLGKPQAVPLRGGSGATYQLELEVNWDGRPGDALRVLGSIDDGGLRAVKRLCEDFILAPDGGVVGEWR
jgi:hypothetical protein